jgi:CO dehydrogenase maturation factor
MKVLICGKGGSGKSTLTALIATAMNNRGYSVLLIDADESNYGLHRMLGISHPVSMLDNLGGKKGFREKSSSAFPQATDAVPFMERIRINEIPEACISEYDGIKMIVVGKIHHFGEGCACPMGLLSKMLLSKFDMGENEVVIVDTAAGVEHFGRGVDADCDMIFAVVDPTFESFALAKKMRNMAIKAGIELYFVLNKVDEKTIEHMKSNIDPKKVVSAIPQSNTIFMSNLEGKTLKTSFQEIDPICKLIEQFKKNIPGT